MPTLMTDPRSGGVKKSSGVNVLPVVTRTWAEVRDDSDPSVDWLITGFDGNSKTDITVLSKGSGGIGACSGNLPPKLACFGGCRLRSGRFVTFFYADEGTPVLQKGRASMYKNGVLNTLEGSDCEIDMWRGLSEDEAVLKVSSDGGISSGQSKSEQPSDSDAAASAELAPAPAPAPAPLVHQKAHTDNAAVTNNIDEIVVAGNGVAVENNVPESKDMSSPSRGLDGFVPYAALKDVRELSSLPPGVDPLNREMALSDEEFINVFGLDKQAFLALPAWKRTSKKKSKGLF